MSELLPVTLLDLIGKRAELAPQSPAVGAVTGAALSYQELHQLCRDIRGVFARAGVRPDQRIAVILPNGPEMATSFLAVACSGVCAPLNPAYREKELDFYLDDLQAAALVVLEGDAEVARNVARARKIPIFNLKPVGGAGAFQLEAPRTESAAAEPKPLSGGDVALVLHTSGTTSRPKQVPLTHANLCASARHIQGTLKLQQTDRCMNVMPLYHIHGLIGAVLSTFSAGGTVVCTPGFEAENFFNWINEQRATWYTAVPTIHQAVVAATATPANKEKLARAKLRFARSSSSALPPTVMAELESLLGAPLVEAYGMTEASHQMACNPLPPGKRKPGSVGLAAGPEVAIMGDDGSLLKPGATGEIVIRGPNVTSGYFSNPQANADAFKNGWFRTGDQGHIDEDGYIFISGRLKEIINRAGEKVSPREVDDVLMEHPAVALALAFSVPHPSLGEDVAAAVVLKPGKTATEEELRRHTSERLADFKVPQRILLVKEIPKGATGKPQRNGLADKLSAQLANQPFVAPQNKAEETLANIWGEVLNVKSVGRSQNYFNLGGDSLQAVVIVRKAKRAGLVFSPTQLFKHPTVGELVQSLETASQAKAAQVTSSLGGTSVDAAAAAKEMGIAPALVEDAFEPPNGATREWMLTYDPALAPVTWQMTSTITGKVDAQLMQRAWDAVIANEPLLRTVFAVKGQRVLQVVLKHAEFTLGRESFKDVPAGELTAKVMGFKASRVQQAFEINRAPLLKVDLLELPEGRFEMTTTWFHPFSDLWMGSLVERKVWTAYSALVKGEAPALLAGPAFREYLGWLAAQTDKKRAEDYWSGAFKGFDWKKHREFFQRGTEQRKALGKRARAPVTLDAKLNEEIRAWTKTHGITFGTLFNAAWGLVQGVYMENPDVAFRAVVSGRWGDFPGIDNIVGPLCAAAPLRVRVEPQASPLAWLRKLQTATVELQQLAHAYYDVIPEAAAPPHAGGLWSYVVIENFPPELWQHSAPGASAVSGGLFAFLPEPMVLVAIPTDDHYRLWLNWDVGLFDGDQASLIEGVKVGIEQLIRNPSDLNAVRTELARVVRRRSDSRAS